MYRYLSEYVFTLARLKTRKRETQPLLARARAPGRRQSNPRKRETRARTRHAYRCDSANVDVVTHSDDDDDDDDDDDVQNCCSLDPGAPTTDDDDAGATKRRRRSEEEEQKGCPNV